MALATNVLPYGLRDVKLTPIDDAGVLGTPVDLPAARTFSFSEAEEFEELRGDDQVVEEPGLELVGLEQVAPVEAHRAQIMERLQISDVPGLVMYALRIGLIQLKP